ncbi:MAG: hypothetical protein ACI89L_001392 [Phycisphaerales bacterium]|jgi:hypothetical protein
MLWLLITITTLGFILLALGLRGRIVGDAPHCRACKFDLTGLDLSPAEAVCPECASRLAEPKAVRIGLRVRPRWLLITGLMIALLPAGLAIPIATGHWTAWNTAKPVWVLGLDTDLGSPSIQDAAYDELKRRAMLLELGADGQLAFLHAQAAKFARAATLDLSELTRVQPAHQSGELSQSRWSKAVLGIDRVVQTYADLFELPETWGLVRTPEGRLEGEGLFPRLSVTDGPTGGLGVLFIIELDEIQVDGVSVKPESTSGATRNQSQQYRSWTHMVIVKNGMGASTLVFSGRPAVRYTSPRNALADLPPGEYELNTTWTLAPFVDPSIGRSGAGRDVLETATPLTPRTLTATTRVTIVQSDPGLIERITDPARVKVAHDYYTMAALEQNTWGLRPSATQGLASFGIDHSWRGGPGPGIAMVGHFELEWGGQRVRPDTTGSSQSPPIVLHPETSGNGGIGWALRTTPPDPRPASATLVFVPDLEAAPNFAGLWSATHGTPMPTVATELRWEDIPVRWLPAPEEAPAEAPLDGSEANGNLGP